MAGIGGNPTQVTLYIARHGQCLGNELRKNLEPSTDLLTPAGVSQAERLGRALKDVKFTRAYSSDYPRAEETAKIVLNECNNQKSQVVELQVDARLRERGVEGYLGAAPSDLVNIVLGEMEKGTPYPEVELPNCEPVSVLENRILDFFSELVGTLRRGSDRRSSSESESAVLLVAHTFTIQRLMMLLNNHSRATSTSGIISFSWQRDLVSEKLMRNASYHKVHLEIPKDDKEPVRGHVVEAHVWDHMIKRSEDEEEEVRGGIHWDNSSSNLEGNNGIEARDEMEEFAADLTSFEGQRNHYLKPV